MSTPLAAFGPGVCIATRTDTVTPLAVNLGYANEMTLEANGPAKELFGTYQYALAVARGTIKLTAKVKAAVLSGVAWNAVFFGMSAFTSGFDHYYLSEAHTVGATTQTVTNATGGITDLGVYYQSNGLPLLRVASAPAVGQYSVVPSTGVYTLNVSDEVPLWFNYSNFSAASGQQLQVTQQLIGTNPTFQFDYYTNLNQPASKPFAFRLFSCVATKLQIASKLEDYIMPEFDFSVFANNSNQVMNIDFPEIS